MSMMISDPDALILIADRFLETAVVACLAALQEQGLGVWLVGATPGLVPGAHGLVVQPDAALGQLTRLPCSRRRLLILAGGATCAGHLLTDPRVHRLIKAVWQEDGVVAALAGAEALALEMGLGKRPSRFLQQGGEETAVFVQRLGIVIASRGNHPATGCA
jgi:putative intracellular protease/amidase